MWIDTLDYIDSLESAYANSDKANKVRSALKAYPTLRAWKEPNGLVRLATPEVNYYVDQMEIRHRTDAMAATLEVLPFLEDFGLKLYSDPVFFAIGHKNPKGFGNVALEDWRKVLEEGCIAKEVISKVKWYLEAHPAIDYTAVDD